MPQYFPGHLYNVQRHQWIQADLRWNNYANREYKSPGCVPRQGSIDYRHCPLEHTEIRRQPNRGHAHALDADPIRLLRAAKLSLRFDEFDMKLNATATVSAGRNVHGFTIME